MFACRKSLSKDTENNIKDINQYKQVSFCIHLLLFFLLQEQADAVIPCAKDSSFNAGIYSTATSTNYFGGGK